MPGRRWVLALVLCLVGAPPADAAWFSGEPVDGPSPHILSVADVDIARDGTGAVVYLRHDYGAAHVFISRLNGGVWRPPERVDVNVHDEATSAAVAAAEGNRLAVLWTAGGRLYGSSYPRVDPTAPLSDPQVLAGGEAADPHLDFGINGTAYGVFTTGGGDVRAVRLFEDRWEAVPPVLDIDPRRAAGAGTGRPRVAVSADGNALAVWGEAGADGRRRLFGRRITGLTLSVFPQEVSLPALGGAPGGDAELPDLDVEDDGSYAWAVFRQSFGGRTRAIARRLVGSRWEAPAVIGGGGPPGAPRIAMSGRGVGAATVAEGAGGAVHASLLEFDAFGPSWRLDTAGSVAGPLVIATEREDQTFVWLAGDPQAATAFARHRPARSAFEPQTAISNPAYGRLLAGAGFVAAADRLGDVAVAFVQAAADGRRLMVAVRDRPPARPLPLTPAGYLRSSRPRLRWQPAIDLWGDQRFRVFVDDEEVGSTTRAWLRPPEPLSQGEHRWRVATSDRRGQEAVGAWRRLLIDSRAPRVRVKASGTPRAGAPVYLRVRAHDPAGGSGVGRSRIAWGDGRRSSGPFAVHRYRRPGRFTVRVAVRDRAGNVTRRKVRLRIG